MALATDTSAAKVQLTLMGLFRRPAPHTAGRPEPLVGVATIGANPAGGIALQAGSIPFHLRAMDARGPRPGYGLLALFGIRDTLDELQHWRTVARNSQAHFAYVQLQAEVGAVGTAAVQRSQLRAQGAALRFVNVRRSAMAFQKELLAQFAAYVAAEGGDPARDMAHVRQMALRPDLYEKVLYDDPDLQHVQVLVFALADRQDPARLRQVAYVRAGLPLQVRAGEGDGVQLQLPDWMQDPVLAAQLRDQRPRAG